MEPVECVFCGKLFEPSRKGHIYCSRQCNSRSAAKGLRKSRVSVKKKRESTIGEVSKKARELGMSYGQYKAMLWMQERKENEK